MDLSQILLFASVSLALLATPGPDMIYVLTRGVSDGRKIGLFSAAGITVGILVNTLLAAIGLAALFKTSAIAFMIVKYAGGAYLLFLGIKTLIASNRISVEETSVAQSNSKAFGQGVLTNVLNPKVAMFILAFLPQFINSSANNPTLQMILLGSAYASLTFILYGTFGYFTGQIGKWLKNHPKVEKWSQRLSGLVFIGLAVRFVFMQQK